MLSWSRDIQGGTAVGSYLLWEALNADSQVSEDKISTFSYTEEY